MPVPDRLFRSLFVALAVGLAWGIRGDFGHLLGASFPGAALGIAFAYAAGGAAVIRRMPLLGVVSALAIAAGGSMSYGMLQGYAQADTLPNFAYGFIMLILQGGAWGTFACGLIGLLLQRRRPGDCLLHERQRRWLRHAFCRSPLRGFPAPAYRR